MSFVEIEKEEMTGWNSLERAMNKEWGKASRGIQVTG